MYDLKSISEERRFQLLVNAVTDYAIYMLDRDGRIATWNPGAERIKGYSADEIIGEHFSRFFTEEDLAADVPARALRIAAREGRYEAEGLRVRKDGTLFWANAVVDPVRAADGSLLGFAKITRDVTERKESERALFESEQRFRMLVQGVRDYAIYMLDRDGRITNWNSGAESIKGYSADEIVGHHFSRFYTEEDRSGGEPMRALETALREGKYEREAWRVRKDGSLFWAHVIIDPIFDERGRHVGFAKITRDATEKKRAQEELERTRAELAQSQKMQALGELTGGIAHDFNNLMTVIAGSADFLLRKPDLGEEKRTQYLEAIAQTAERATTLTNHLLAFGRRQTLRPEVLDLNLRLDALSELLSRTLGSTIEMALDLGDAPMCIEVDAAQLETAILNAVVNARDAMPSGGRITLRTAIDKKDPDSVRLDIVDTGEGMAPDVIDRAFEPFFTTKEVGKGTGLGLSQIHGFAAQAGGHAAIASEPGKGTTISIILPRTHRQPEPVQDEKPLTALPAGLKVLLVEDNAQVRHFGEELLIDLGCDVECARDGQEALELLDRSSFDLVFSDVVMPGMSGVELAALVRNKHPSVPVLLATGYSAEIVGGDRTLPVVAKPYGARALAAAMAELIEGTDNAACG